MSNGFRDVVFDEHYFNRFKQQAYLSYLQGRNDGWNEILSVIQVMVEQGLVITAESVALNLQEMLVESEQMTHKGATPTDIKSVKAARKNHLSVVPKSDV